MPKGGSTAGVTGKRGIWRTKPPDAESAVGGRIPESAGKAPHLSAARGVGHARLNGARLSPRKRPNAEALNPAGQAPRLRTGRGNHRPLDRRTRRTGGRGFEKYQKSRKCQRAAQRFALLAGGRAWTMFGSRKNSKPEKCSKMPQN